MPIDITCTGCKTRFQVSDKFAGQKGPCPKCKAIIQVPAKTEQVVVHAPEVSGPKDSKGRSVLKPLTRSETKVTPLRIGAAVGVVVLVLAAALYFRLSQDPKAFPFWPLIAGALLVAPLTCWSGYGFLRDDELEPYLGRQMALRTAVCSLLYAAMWAAYLGVKIWVLDGKSPQSFEFVYVAPPLVALGGAVGWGCYGLNYGTGLMHFAFYLVVTVVLRKLAGLALL